MTLLRKAHREQNLDQVMYRSLVGVDWRGFLDDCGFNQQLGMPIGDAGKPRVHLIEISADRLEGANDTLPCAPQRLAIQESAVRRRTCCHPPVPRAAGLTQRDGGSP